MAIVTVLEPRKDLWVAAPAVAEAEAVVEEDDVPVDEVSAPAEVSTSDEVVGDVVDDVTAEVVLDPTASEMV